MRSTRQQARLAGFVHVGGADLRGNTGLEVDLVLGAAGAADVEGPSPLDRGDRRVAPWPRLGGKLAFWENGRMKLGESATRGLPRQPTATEILAADRGRLERR